MQSRPILQRATMPRWTGSYGRFVGPAGRVDAGTPRDLPIAACAITHEAPLWTLN
jgi:hypothetical protein